MRRPSRKKCMDLFTGYMKGRGFQENTILTKQAYIRIFHTWLDEWELADIRQVKREDLVEFFSWLQVHPGKRGKGYSERTRRTILTTVKQFFLCLYENDLILTSPAQDLRIKGTSDTIKEILSEEETALFLDSIDINASFGLRDRAMFELIYSSGLRAAEAAGLSVRDYDPSSRLLWIHQSKFSKDRRVPVTRTAAVFLDLYLKGVRAQHRPLFRSGGYQFTTPGINKRFKLLARRCGLYREGLTVHSLRHGCASHLLAHGAEIRYVQELLGHESVETTVGYSVQNEENIKASYRQHHPRENAFFCELSDSYRRELDRLAGDSMKQREKNEKALARRIRK